MLIRTARGGRAAGPAGEIVVHDMLQETSWGDYPSYAAACGLRASLSLSLPIAAHPRTAGALNLYAAPAGASSTRTSEPCAPRPPRPPAPSPWPSA